MRSTEEFVDVYMYYLPVDGHFLKAIYARELHQLCTISLHSGTGRNMLLRKRASNISIPRKSSADFAPTNLHN
jgi:hypothetical protein